MKLKYMQLNNFRQFKGMQEVNFSTDPNANLTLILGNNTSGKTTLLQAFLWCLYGKTNFKNKDSHLLNKEVEEATKISGEDAETKVILKIDFHGNEYVIERIQKYAIKKNELKPGKVYISLTYKEDGKMNAIQEESEINSSIESMLPKDLSSYFFYDTERFGNVSKKEDVYEAVNTLLGLKVLEKALEHLGTEGRKNTVLNLLSSDLDLEGDQQAKQAQKQLEELESALEQYKKDIDLNTEEINKFLKLIDNHDERLRELKETADNQKEYDEKVTLLKEQQTEVNRLHKNLIQSFNQNMHYYLSAHLHEKTTTILANVDLLDKGISDMNARSIEDIIERGKCLCGAEICAGNEAHQNLINEMRYLPPQSLGNVVKTYRNNMNNFTSASQGFFTNITNHNKNYLLHKRKMSITEGQLKTLREKIDGTEKVSLLVEQRKEYERKVAQLNQQHGAFTEKVNATVEKIEKKKKVLINSSLSTAKNKLVSEQIAYANEAKKFIENYYNNQAKAKKFALEEKVNSYFQRMYHGSRILKIDDKYRVELQSNIENEGKFISVVTDESQGLETVKNFSFISGLVELAKNNIVSRTDSIREAENEDYFLVLDAPFSNTDAIHVKNISEILPEVASQLILIVMAKDWNYAEKSMVDVVGKRYELIKHSETYTEIKEVTS